MKNLLVAAFCFVLFWVLERFRMGLGDWDIEDLQTVQYIRQFLRPGTRRHTGDIRLDGTWPHTGSVAVGVLNL